eukprot:gene6987-6769_t
MSARKLHRDGITVPDCMQQCLRCSSGHLGVPSPRETAAHWFFECPGIDGRAGAFRDRHWSVTDKFLGSSISTLKAPYKTLLLALAAGYMHPRIFSKAAVAPGPAGRETTPAHRAAYLLTRLARLVTVMWQMRCKDNASFSADSPE